MFGIGFDFIVYLFFWILFCFLVANYAKRQKGKPFWQYFFISFWFSPLAGIIFAILAKQDDAGIVAVGDKKKCPMCAEMIKAEAKLCRYCGHKFEKPLSSGDDLGTHQKVSISDNVENLSDKQKRILADGRCPECNDTIDANDFMCKSCRFDFSHLQNKH